MRASISTALPDGEALYEDCVTRVREALLEIPRPKRRGSIPVLISMWVLSTVADDDSLIKDAHLVAELAQVYENEVNGFWVSAEHG